MFVVHQNEWVAGACVSHFSKSSIFSRWWTWLELIVLCSKQRMMLVSVCVPYAINTRTHTIAIIASTVSEEDTVCLCVWQWTTEFFELTVSAGWEGQASMSCPLVSRGVHCANCQAIVVAHIPAILPPAPMLMCPLLPQTFPLIPALLDKGGKLITQTTAV